MGNYRKPEQTEEIKGKALLSAAKLFLKKGYELSTVKEIADVAGITKNTLLYVFKTKEEILADLVSLVLEKQFSMATEMLKGKTEDKMLYYAVETTLQLYITESSEHIRELYVVAYSLPRTTEIIQHTITGKLEGIFKEHLPNLETKDFFELEVASGGIMRGFMTIPCDLYFTMDRKVKRFLETTFKIYDVPKEKIEETIAFVSQFDYPKITKNTIDSMIDYLEKNIKV